MKKPLPIGVDDFEKLITNGYYYVDKTLFIKELIDKKGDVNLFTRPRRFGKTLNMSMLRYYFENTGDDSQNAKNCQLFNGLAITGCDKTYTDRMAKYPVIYLTLKSGKQPTFKMAWESLIDEIIKEYNRHDFVKYNGKLLPNEIEQFNAIQNKTASALQYAKSLDFLSSCLAKYYSQKVIVLIDEYDVPLENGYFNGFYDKMADFCRSLFESVFKSNANLEFGVITGCLRITKESIFTGLNNFKIISILSNMYDEYFGFTQDEVNHLLKSYNCEDKKEIIKKWYDGYRFGSMEVYNPWSVINFLDALKENPEALPVPYWANTSSNDIVKSLIDRADMTAKKEMEDLLSGNIIEKPIHEEITYDSIYDSTDNLWNFLFFTGYLRMVSVRMDGRNRFITMAVPNEEVAYIYENTITGWFREQMQKKDLTCLYHSILYGDAATFQNELSSLLLQTISYMDSGEKFYHGFLLGILGNLKEYSVLSNRESGNGRYDILIQSPDINYPPVIMELKAADSYKSLEASCELALQQIEDKGYEGNLGAEGYSTLIYYGIAFFRKQCRIKVKTKNIQ